MQNLPAGVDLLPSGNYRGRVTIAGVRYSVGAFPTPEEAAAEIAAEELRTQGQKINGEGYVAQGIAAQEVLDPCEVLERARAEFRRTARKVARRKSQQIVFDSWRVGLVFLADLHLGSKGTDIDRLFDEIALVMAMPNTYIITAGDLLDNFVIGKLRQARDNSRLAVTEEWVLVRYLMETIAPRWLVAVGGNHDSWGLLLTGEDWMRHEVAKFSPQTLYDGDDCLVSITTGGACGCEFPVRIRHKWRGNSIYNPTHGIERAAKWDQDFRLGVGAHTHESGLARPFNNAGITGIAVLCGSYKRDDDFARRLGFPKSNESTAVGVILDGRLDVMSGCEHLSIMAELMHNS